jgi:hypothetical protein
MHAGLCVLPAGFGNFRVALLSWSLGLTEPIFTVSRRRIGICLIFRYHTSNQVLRMHSKYFDISDI